MEMIDEKELPNEWFLFKGNESFADYLLIDLLWIDGTIVHRTTNISRNAVCWSMIKGWRLSKPSQPSISQEPKYSHYKKDVRHLDMVDIYRVCELWQVGGGPIEHAIKKLLCSGKRGAKDKAQDVQEAIDSLIRWQAMRAEDEKS